MSTTPIPTSKIANANFLGTIDPKDVQDLKASLKLRRMIFVTHPKQFKEMLFPSTNPKKLARVDLRDIYRVNTNIRRVINILIRDADDYIEEVTYYNTQTNKRKSDDRKEIVRSLKEEHIR